MNEFILRSLVIGVGATLIYDVWGFLLVRLFGFPGSNWKLAGRWFCHVARGRPLHDNIGDARSFRMESLVGWTVHYLIGIVYAALLLAIWGVEWSRDPTLLPALIVGVGTIAAGWFIMAPAMGAGFASAKRPDANRVRIIQLAGHLVFGLGLYAAALIPL
jgi:hypothetical protein